MRIGYILELVVAIGVGLGLARHRLTDPDLAYSFGVLSWFVSFEIGADAFFAGVGLVGGLAVLVERLRGRSPSPWGPGRRVWFLVASYLLIILIDRILGTVMSRLFMDAYFSSSISDEIVSGMRGEYGEFLFPSMAWFLLALGLTSLTDHARRNLAADSRDWGGRLFAALLVSTWLGLRVLVLFNTYKQSMGGGMS